MWKVSTKRKKMLFGEWYRLLLHGSFEKQLQLELLTRPDFVGIRVVPTDLNLLSFGQIIQLQEIADIEKMFIIPAQVILGMDESEVMKSDAVEIVRFSAWVAKEMGRINKLFSSTNRRPTRQELEAGIEGLKFGIFGTVDWYALRMGIEDHEKVMEVPWMRVFKCLQIDSEKHKYELRLRKVYERERDAKKKG